jgi:hypothetical protein
MLIHSRQEDAKDPFPQIYRACDCHGSRHNRLPKTLQTPSSFHSTDFVKVSSTPTPRICTAPLTFCARTEEEAALPSSPAKPRAPPLAGYSQSLLEGASESSPPHSPPPPAGAVRLPTARPGRSGLAPARGFLPTRRRRRRRRRRRPERRARSTSASADGRRGWRGGGAGCCWGAWRTRPPPPAPTVRAALPAPAAPPARLRNPSACCPPPPPPSAQQHHNKFIEFISKGR